LFGVAADSSDNVYTASIVTISSVDKIVVAKFNASGTLQWQTAIEGATFNRVGLFGVDSSGNVYVGTQSGQYLFKWNTSGVLQWQRLVNSGFSNGGYQGGVDSSGNSYMGIYSVNNPRVGKISTSGSVSWAYEIQSGVYNPGYGAATDSSGNNAYAPGNSDNFAGSSWSTVSKIDSGGTSQWMARLATNPATFSKVTADTSNNVYSIGLNAGTSTAKAFIIKQNSSGGVTWSRLIDTPTVNAFGFALGIAVDNSNGDVYGLMWRAGSSNLFVAKLNSSGTLQWVRTIATTSSSQDLWTNWVSISSTSVYVTLRDSADTRAITFKLPKDGSKTGTYTIGGVSFTISATSSTTSDPSYSASIFSPTSNTQSWSSSASSLTTSTPTLTSSTTNL
jgi:hypothetical protein